MRQLVFVCEQKDVSDLGQAIARFIHPGIAKSFVAFVEVDTASGNQEEAKYAVLDTCRNVLRQSTNRALVCATKEAGSALKLRQLLSNFSIEYQEHAKSFLCGSTAQNIRQLLSSCGLTINPASAEMFTGWAHHQLDLRQIEAWAAQFNQLGKPWLASAILGSMRFIGLAELGDLLFPFVPGFGHALSVNHDKRTHGKSAEVIANLMVKRTKGDKVFESPADAVEEGFRKITLMEDGLFTGTEAVGVLQSLLGERQPESLKTKPLKDPNLFPQIDLRLTYGVGTDYGKSVVSRFLAERGYLNVTIDCAETIHVTNKTILTEIETGRWPMATLWETGPPDSAVSPYFIRNAIEAGGLYPAQITDATDFCTKVGRQLFYNYTQEMKTRRPDFRDWADSKLDKCAFGMWGQGLTITFSHSLPKASLPLLWGTGPVAYGGRQVRAWQPLFPNSW